MKKTRQEKREEEARIVAEMDEAMQNLQAEQGQTTPKEKPPKAQKNTPRPDEYMPEKMHCKRCKTLMENGVCPTCGFKVYIPMEKEKRNKIKVVVTAIAMALFVVIFLAMQFVK